MQDCCTFALPSIRVCPSNSGLLIFSFVYIFRRPSISTVYIFRIHIHPSKKAEIPNLQIPTHSTPHTHPPSPPPLRRRSTSTPTTICFPPTRPLPRRLISSILPPNLPRTLGAIVARNDRYGDEHGALAADEVVLAREADFHEVVYRAALLAAHGAGYYARYSAAPGGKG